jgi:predicted Zn-dependent peptidase
MKHTVSEVDLKNGAKGLFINIPDASVMTFEVNFRAGEYLVSEDKWETPHLMEHVLLGANELIPKARLFQAEFEKNGAYSNASTGTYDINYEAECADFEWDRVASMLLTAISKPLFLQEEFDAEYGNVVEELNARSNNHFRHLSLALRGEYGYKVLTDQKRLELIENVKLDDIKQHYETTHVSTNMRFIIAGKLNPKRKKILTELLDNIELPRGNKRFILPNETPKSLKKPLYLHNNTIDNMYFYIDTFMRRKMTNEESDALSLINTMLTETLYSRILGEAREHGLVYHMSSGIGQSKSSANWWFGAQIMPKNAERLFSIINRELTKVFDADISKDDIVAAKQYSLGRYQRSGQTVSGVAAGYASRYFFDGYIEDYYQFPERIESVDRDKIVEISKNLFREKVWGMGVLGSCANDFVDRLVPNIESLWLD